MLLSLRMATLLKYLRNLILSCNSQRQTIYKVSITFFSRRRFVVLNFMKFKLHPGPFCYQFILECMVTSIIRMARINLLFDFS